MNSWLGDGGHLGVAGAAIARIALVKKASTFSLTPSKLCLPFGFVFNIDSSDAIAVGQ